VFRGVRSVDEPVEESAGQREPVTAVQPGPEPSTDDETEQVIS